MDTGRTIKKMLLQQRREQGLHALLACDDEQNSKYADMLKKRKELPGDVKKGLDQKFFKVVAANLTEVECLEYLMYKQIRLLDEIRRHVRTLAVIAIIAIVASVVSALYYLL